MEKTSSPKEHTSECDSGWYGKGLSQGCKVIMKEDRAFVTIGRAGNHAALTGTCLVQRGLSLLRSGVYYDWKSGKVQM